ncbi:MAG: hypothetical protein HQ580_00290 [Planctomycetes bacterium]|nr:hypothetical protein [Planctomycetota bacterium]
MKDYWLSKLISSVKKVDSRKRLQKSIYLLQLADCPLKCDYLLHYYGPYSFELADLIDQLKGAEIIKESADLTGYGNQRYISQIADKGTRVLGEFEKSKTGKDLYAQIKRFVPLFQKLNQEDLWVLELGATVGYYYKGNWEVALIQTAAFKKIRKDDKNLLRAIELAKAFVPAS